MNLLCRPFLARMSVLHCRWMVLSHQHRVYLNIILFLSIFSIQNIVKPWPTRTTGMSCVIGLLLLTSTWMCWSLIYKRFTPLLIRTDSVYVLCGERLLGISISNANGSANTFSTCICLIVTAAASASDVSWREMVVVEPDETRTDLFASPSKRIWPRILPPTKTWIETKI